MKNNLWDLDNALVKLDILKDKFEMLETTLSWFKDDKFPKPNLSNKDERETHYLSYREQFIFLDQHRDLLEMYLKNLNEVQEELLTVFNEFRNDESTKKVDTTQADQSEVIPTNRSI